MRYHENTMFKTEKYHDIFSRKGPEAAQSKGLTGWKWRPEALYLDKIISQEEHSRRNFISHSLGRIEVKSHTERSNSKKMICMWEKIIMRIPGLPWLPWSKKNIMRISGLSGLPELWEPWIYRTSPSVLEKSEKSLEPVQHFLEGKNPHDFRERS